MPCGGALAFQMTCLVSLSLVVMQLLRAGTTASHLQSIARACRPLSAALGLPVIRVIGTSCFESCTISRPSCIFTLQSQVAYISALKHHRVSSKAGRLSYSHSSRFWPRPRVPSTVQGLEGLLTSSLCSQKIAQTHWSAELCSCSALQPRYKVSRCWAFARQTT